MESTPRTNPVSTGNTLFAAVLGVGLMLAGGAIASGAGAVITAEPQAPEVPEDVREFLEEPEPGDTVRLRLATGSSLTGILISRSDTAIVVRVERLEMRFKPSEVTDVIRQPSPAELFDRRRSAISPRDISAMLELARWARDQELYERALETVAEVLDRSPQLEPAILLEREIALQQRLAQESGGGSQELDDRRARREQLRIRAFPMLTEEQISLIKVYEMDLTDPPRISVPKEAVNRLFEEHADHPLVPDSPEGRRAFSRQPDVDILDVIFRAQARELYPLVRVTGQLKAMEDFRDRINAGWLARSCATTECHGGLNGGQFLLTNRFRRTERAVYTNFYILNQFETSDGLPMIDAEEPRLSVLLQMGLPQEDALWPHPEVIGWRPVFRSEEDERFQRAAAWIDGLYTPRPEYELDYLLPGDRPRAELRGEAADAPRGAEESSSGAGEQTDR